MGHSLLVAHLDGVHTSRSNRSIIHSVNDIQLNDSTASDSYLSSLDESEQRYAATSAMDPRPKCPIDILILIFYGGK